MTHDDHDDAYYHSYFHAFPHIGMITITFGYYIIPVNQLFYLAYGL